MKRARYIMIGGFLGAGKTTVVGKLAEVVTARGLRAGLITNDQGNELVDTASLRARGFATEEIAGGCFCCRFSSLTEAAETLTGTVRPDVFIAEPVGSCTDLVATVTYPLRRMYGGNYTIAPLSVLVDPVRAMKALGLEEGRKFSEKVLYIYRKQLEEADWIVINKLDLINEEQRAALVQALKTSFPKSEVLAVCARTGEGLEAWFHGMLSEEQQPRDIMEVDYQLYAEGEALLGWLNATVRIRSDRSWDGNEALERFGAELRKRLSEVEVAHLKMTLSPDRGLGGLSVLNWVRSEFVPELSLRLEERVEGGAEVIVNARAETEPERLQRALEEAVRVANEARDGTEWQLEHLEAFRPGKPEPTHRMEALPRG